MRKQRGERKLSVVDNNEARERKARAVVSLARKILNNTVVNTIIMKGVDFVRGALSVSVAFLLSE